jgi:hypothetical protein
MRSNKWKIVIKHQALPMSTQEYANLLISLNVMCSWWHGGWMCEYRVLQWFWALEIRIMQSLPNFPISVVTKMVVWSLEANFAEDECS